MNSPGESKNLRPWLAILGSATLILTVVACGNWLLWFGEMNAAYDYLDGGNLLGSRDHFQNAIVLCSILPGDPRKLRSTKDLSKLYYARRAWQKAENLCRQVLDLEAGMHGKESLEYVHALADLAMGARKQERYAEAETLYRQAWAKVASSPENLATKARVLNGLSWVLIKQKKYGEARSCLDQSLEITRHCPDRFEQVLPLAQRAFLNRQTARQSEERSDLLEAYKVITEPDDLSFSSAETVVGLTLLAQLLSWNNEADQAEKTFRIAEQNCKTSVFARQFNLFMVDILSAHGKHLQAQGSWEKAEELAQQAKSLRQQSEL